MPDKRAVISITRPLRGRIRVVQNRMRQELGRAVSIAEAIERLADDADRYHKMMEEYRRDAG